MAEAAGHKLGQVIGEYVERAIEPLLKEFADQHGLYLDKRGQRLARKGKKLRWLDVYNNAHDLDYVLERGGSHNRVGTPVAFIESAWRRYTKHSKNKAQEIQGAILPIASRHRFAAPLLACVLAGDYTKNSLDQLRSLGFQVLYFPYTLVIEAFRHVGMDVAYDEQTPDSELTAKLRKWSKLPDKKKEQVGKRLLQLNDGAVQEFMALMHNAVMRQIAVICVLPLHGTAVEFPSVPDAIRFVESYASPQCQAVPFVKYELQVRYNNGDRVEAQFQDRPTAIGFLNAFSTGNWTTVVEVPDEDA
jgi:hypothetical protein